MIKFAPNKRCSISTGFKCPDDLTVEENLRSIGRRTIMPCDRRSFIPCDRRTMSHVIGTGRLLVNTILYKNCGYRRRVSHI